MNREIKFRAYYQLSKRFVYPIDIKEFQYSINYVDLDEYPTFQQYTGLKDKTGKEIYEGDFVKVKDSLNGETFQGYISFDCGSFIIKSSYISHYRWVDYSCEIIGNIYENPELLEDESN
jgi:hypothetical protein